MKNCISVEKISGFACKEPVIRIYSDTEKIWYLYHTKGIKTRFNLPKGNFFTENNLEKLESPVQFRLPVLPRKNFNPVSLPEFKVMFTENPNKCSVNVKTGQVFFDNSFRNYPEFILQFILFHEAGHLFYRGEGHKSERNCDLFAAYHLLKRGMNPSQIRLAQGVTLKDEYRKQHLLNHLQKAKK